MDKIKGGKPENYKKHLRSIDSERLYIGLLDYGMISDRFSQALNSVGLARALDQPVTSGTAAVYSGPQLFECIDFASERDVEGARLMQLPNPIPYASLCNVLRENWKEIRKYLINNAKDWPCCISRIHLRPMRDTNALFVMNYHDYSNDDDSETQLSFGARYLVKADISSCFPTFYTHALPWALVGRKQSKDMFEKKRRKSDDYLLGDRIDRACQRISSSETHGIPIGPHSSNLIAEIVLTAIDKELVKKRLLFHSKY